ncbi:exonuclease SbcC [Gordonia hydrophobica]|uniref:Exonuclease SbcC n=1 Tax=Gordonia hydrophobica TaxID=40516 RepID=A0ABZ2U580_9ACTN
MPTDFDLTTSELRAVADYALAAARSVARLLDGDDPRPRAALDAAAQFIDGAPRSKVQRTAALDAHRAAKGADSESAACAAHAAGDACAAAYLHPLAQATQVGHILRASAYGRGRDRTRRRRSRRGRPRDPCRGAAHARGGARRAAPLPAPTDRTHPRRTAHDNARRAGTRRRLTRDRSPT